MGLFFGTDGLRGRVNEDLTFEVAYKIGNALSILKRNPTIIIGSDTRVSNTYLTLGVASGAMSGGADIIDIGIAPTAGVAYITKELKADYGVVISASHNSGEYNGIKVFNGEGFKLGDKEEERIERCFIQKKINSFPNIGSYKQDFNLTKIYKNYLIKCAENSFNGKTIVLDCAHGAACRIAPEVFKSLGAKVIASNCVNDGLKINDGCGALYPQNLVKRVFRYKADMGFAFDGDSDRLIAVDNKGNVIDGDQIIYALAKHLKKADRLKGNVVVGTSHTNMAIEEGLKKIGIDLIRTDIGDKYVLSKMLEKNLSLGGEQSGHIIISDYATTGDGILSAIMVADMVIKEKKTLEEIIDIDLYPQENINVVVFDKFRVMNNEILNKEVSKYNVDFGSSGRVMIRASGTEPKIRIMVESSDSKRNVEIANSLVKIVKAIDTEI